MKIVDMQLITLKITGCFCVSRNSKKTQSDLKKLGEVVVSSESIIQEYFKATEKVISVNSKNLILLKKNTCRFVTGEKIKTPKVSTKKLFQHIYQKSPTNLNHRLYDFTIHNLRKCLQCMQVCRYVSIGIYVLCPMYFNIDRFYQATACLKQRSR